MLIGLSIIVAFITFVAYRGSKRWVFLPSASPPLSTSAHEVSPSSSSRSFLKIMWTYLWSPVISGMSYSPRSAEGRTRGISVSEGGICTGGGSSLTAKSSPLLPPILPEMKFSSASPDNSPDSTPKARPVNGIALTNGGLNGKIPKLTLSNDSLSDSEDDNSPPSFPALTSAQRARPPLSNARSLSPSSISRQSRYPSAVTRAPSVSISHSPDSSSAPSLSYNSMPPPPLPHIRGRNPRSAPTTLPFPSRLPSSSYSQSTSLARGGGGGSTLPSNEYHPGTAGGNGMTSHGGISSISLNSSNFLRLPPTTTAPPPKPKAKGKPKYSRKIILEPGHSPLDWARLCRTSTQEVLRGPGLPNRLLKVSPSMLAKHGRAPPKPIAQIASSSTKASTTTTNGIISSNSKAVGEKDQIPNHQMWTALNGKVYNITAYTPFHPGGEKELLRCAGKDGTELFMKTHSWVNIEGMLGDCLVGVYVGEDEGEDENEGEGEGEGKGERKKGEESGTWLDDVD